MAVKSGRTKSLTVHSHVHRAHALVAQLEMLSYRQKRHEGQIVAKLKEVNKLMQAVVDERSVNYPHAMRGIMVMKEYEKLWLAIERRLPGFGTALLDFLAPSIGSKASYVARPALPDLEARLRTALPWMSFKDVRRFNYYSNEEYEQAIALMDQSEHGINPYVHDLIHPHGVWYGWYEFPKQHKKGEAWLSEDFFWKRLYAKLKEAASQDLPGREHDEIDDGILDAIVPILGLGIRRILNGESADDLKPLLALFTAGNFPLFKVDDTLLVFTA